MSDEKLNKLIEEYAQTRIWYDDEYCDDVTGECAKSKQAILDYVGKGRLSRLIACAKQEATVHIKEIWEKYEDRPAMRDGSIETHSGVFIKDIWQAISKTMKDLEEK